MLTSVLEVKDLSVSYGNNLVVDKISFNVQEGDLLGIVGPNGAGKTTLFRAILQLEQYLGTVKLFGLEKYNTLLPLIGYVPQKIVFEPNFPATIYDIVSMGIIPDKKLVDADALVHWKKMYRTKTDDEKITTALKTVGLESLRDRRIGELSGGEVQRVFIAKSLVKDPLLLILDEPVTSVDVESQTKFYDVIKKVNQETAIVWSSHDLDAISKYANKVACMNKRLSFHGEKDAFFSNEKLLKTYTESSMQRTCITTIWCPAMFEILTYSFIQKALMAGIAVALICSFMGTFLVLRRYSMFGDGISHVAFGGISVGLFLGVFPLWMAFVASILGGLGLEKLRKNTMISGDAAVAIVLVSGLALGVVLISSSDGFTVDLFSFLFGNILLISDADTMLILLISAGILSVLFVLYKQFLHLTFSEEQAKISGLAVNALNYTFVILASITVVTSMRLVGILLISALIVLPNITAMMFGKGFKKTVGIAMCISVVSVVCGIFASFHYDIAPSGIIVLIAVSILLGTLTIKSTRRGLK